MRKFLEIDLILSKGGFQTWDLLIMFHSLYHLSYLASESLLVTVLCNRGNDLEAFWGLVLFSLGMQIDQTGAMDNSSRRRKILKTWPKKTSLPYSYHNTYKSVLIWSALRVIYSGVSFSFIVQPDKRFKKDAYYDNFILGCCEDFKNIEVSNNGILGVQSILTRTVVHIFHWY